MKLADDSPYRAPDKLPEMYAHREPNGQFTLRQKRYKANLKWGNEHPNDVAAVANSVEDLRKICRKLWPDADYSEVQS